MFLSGVVSVFPIRCWSVASVGAVTLRRERCCLSWDKKFMVFFCKRRSVWSVDVDVRMWPCGCGRVDVDVVQGLVVGGHE